MNHSWITVCGIGYRCTQCHALVSTDVFEASRNTPCCPPEEQSKSMWRNRTCGECGWYRPSDCAEDFPRCRHQPARAYLTDPACPAFVPREEP